MSKIGRKAIAIPSGVEIKTESDKIEVKGPKGVLSLKINSQIKVVAEKEEIIISKIRESKEANAVWGLTRALINNLVEGVTKGYNEKLELQGVGFRMSVQGKKIVMALGFSHPVEVSIPDGLTAKVEENNILTIEGISKSEVGQFAADIRKLKKTEPYKGKGFRYQGEKVRRKIGKKAGTVK